MVWLLALAGCGALGLLEGVKGDAADPDPGSLPGGSDDSDTDTDVDSDTDTDTDVDSDSDSDTTEPVDSGTVDTGTAEATTVYDLQAGLVAPGTAVTVSDVVVTATAPYGFYVQERDGGASSGIWVFGDLGWDNTWSVVPGDRVTVEGRFEEFFGLSELDVTGGAVAVTGTTDVPEPELVALADLQTGSAEPWESVLVRVEGLELTVSDAGYGEFEVGNDAGLLLRVDDQLHTWSWFGVPSPGATVHAVQGVLNYSGGDFVLEPRSDDDIEVAAVTPYEVQQGAVGLGDPIELYGVVVTGVASDGVWVQDERGGEHSGVWVYLGIDWDTSWGPLVVGDRVDLWGVANEYYDLTEIDVPSSPSPWVGWRAAGPAPIPEVVAVGDLGEPWEGVLVQVEDVEVVDPDLGFGEWSVTPNNSAGTDVVHVDDRIHAWSGFAELAAGDRFDVVAGPLHYAYGAFGIDPRDELDVVAH